METVIKVRLKVHALCTNLFPDCSVKVEWKDPRHVYYTAGLLPREILCFIVRIFSYPQHELAMQISRCSPS